MRNFRLAIVLVCLCYLTTLAHPEVIKPDLVGGEVIGKGTCNFPPHIGYCFVVDKFSTRWVAVHDQKGQLAIYAVKPSAMGKEHITPEDVQLVWQRDST